MSLGIFFRQFGFVMSSSSVHGTFFGAAPLPVSGRVAALPVSGCVTVPLPGSGFVTAPLPVSGFVTAPLPVVGLVAAPLPVLIGGMAFNVASVTTCRTGVDDAPFTSVSTQLIA